ncbi:MAG: histidinol dehydrogenase, partial [Hungatella sp.]
MRIVKLDAHTKQNILSDLLKRDPNNYDQYAATVQEIIENVKLRKDEALFAYTKQFDGAD